MCDPVTWCPSCHKMAARPVPVPQRQHKMAAAGNGGASAAENSGKEGTMSIHTSQNSDQIATQSII